MKMAWHACPKCGEWRKVDVVIASDGWHQPPCYACGDPGYLEPLEELGLKAQNKEEEDELA